MNEAEKLARLFLEALQKTRPALIVIEKAGNMVPMAKWEDLTDSMRKIFIAACADVLRNWNPSHVQK